VSTFQFIIGFLVLFALALLLGWTEQNVKSPAASASVGIGAILLLLLMGGWGDFHYIPHTVETSISAQSNWLVGEMKDCYSEPLDPASAFLLHREPGYVAESFNCDDGPKHTMTIKFYGRLNQPEHRIAYWRCTRKSEEFICRQTGAE
jgi:hypothetical protein